jgi:hypothetical protein
VHICRLSSKEICLWKCGHNEGRCGAFAVPFGDLLASGPLIGDSSSPRNRQSLVVNLEEVRVYGLLSIELEQAQ